MSALNPNHHVTKAMDGNWHKLLAIFMLRQGVKSFTVTEEDVASLQVDGQEAAVVVHSSAAGLKVHILSVSEAAEMARKAGGLPN